ncbi:Polysialic acid transport protein KpsD precursor [Jannaschia seosinensis]|uniref:Polysialic acid transport protein KpsD n=1 Tax=Jannaschia seosinensis TaxID=313367 RepID=A0A0M7B9B8_9RHOB|nr:polysaccharide biosynthesis/export family protein [Jannaschia seosinensis]CUH21434.1 Polysialic acid transport protein KpsD precursor [Jannaschia seosinensis]
MRTILFAIMAFIATHVATGAAWAQSGYRLNPGDVLAVEVLEDASLNREVLVLPDGSINFPFAGSIPVGGRTVAETQQAIAQGIASNFASTPNVFATVRRLRPETPAAPAAIPGINIYFLGEVAAPGLTPVAPGTTMLQALAQAGGFTPFAATRRIQLRRTDPRTGQQSVFLINYKAISNGAVVQNDFPLADGDVIVAPARGLFE